MAIWKKVCPQCKVEKGWDDYHGGVRACKTCIAAHDKIRSAEYRKNNKEKEAERHRVYALNNKDKVKETQKRYRDRHPDRIKLRWQNWTLSRPGYDTQRTRDFKEKFPEIARERYRKYNSNPKTLVKTAARKRNLVYTPEAAKHAAWCKTQTCVYCQIPGNFGTHDHVIPISRGGPNNIDNIVPACSLCNDSKGTKFLYEWKNRWYQ